MGKVLGIDLGTTNSVMAIMEGGQPTVLANAEGSRLTPSVVGFSKAGERIVGEPAKRQAISNPDRTITSIKRKMGTHEKIEIDGKGYSPQEISAMILQKMKMDAERYLGTPITQAVITVPAYFDDSQRQATKDAGAIAGLEVLRIINEPTASALAYGLDKQEQTLTVLVFDLGGGTFDVSILEIGQGVFEVKSTAGNTHLGGDDWDHELIEYCADEFKKQTGIDLHGDKMAMQRLKDACEKAKIELSNLLQTNINLPFITADASGPKHLDINMTRAKFEEMTKDLVEKCKGPTMRALEDAKMTPQDINRVLLVGGSTRMPMIIDYVRGLFGKEPSKDINPDECVALGAAIQGAVLSGEVKDVVLVDVTPLTLGIETLGGVMTKLIPRNTAIPTSKSESFTTAADMQPAVEIHVLQGEREMAENNKTLGKFVLADLPPAPRGVPQIEVTFDIDSNGILNVTAKDRATGKSQKIQITATTNLGKDEVSRLVDEGSKFEADDKRKREAVEVKNQADASVYRSEKLLKDLEGKLAPEKKAKAEAAIAALRSAVESNDAARMKSAMTELDRILSELSSELYAQAGAQPGAGQQAGAGPEAGGAPHGEAGAGAQAGGDGGHQGEVIDADYKVEN